MNVSSIVGRAWIDLRALIPAALVGGVAAVTAVFLLDPEPPNEAPVVAAAAEAAAPAGPAAALTGLLDAGGVIHSQRPIGAHLVAYEISFNGGRDIYYTTADGKHLLIGALIDGQGANVTKALKGSLGLAENTPALAPVQPMVDLNAVYAQLEEAAKVTVAGNATELYVLYEPNCPYCARLHHALADSAATVHYVPVAFLAPDSVAASEVMLSLAAAEPALSELALDVLAGGGVSDWIAKYGPASGAPDARAAIAANKGIMDAAGITGTPAIIYKNAAGEIEVLKGLPSGTVLASIGG